MLCLAAPSLTKLCQVVCLSYCYFQAYVSQTNKRCKLKYGTLIVITAPWEAMCINLIGPYTLKGKDGTEIDFMCLTMDPVVDYWIKMIQMNELENLWVYKLILELENGTRALDVLWVSSWGSCVCDICSGVDIRPHGWTDLWTDSRSGCSRVNGILGSGCHFVYGVPSVSVLMTWKIIHRQYYHF